MSLFFNFLKNSFFLTIAVVIDRIADFLLVIYLTRFLSQEDIGIYFVVITILFICQNLVNYGLVQLATREIAQDTTNIQERIYLLGVIGIGLGILSTILLLLAIPFLGDSEGIATGLQIVAFSLLPGSLRGVGEAVFTAVERVENIAWVTGISGVARTVLSFIALWLGWGINGIFLILVLTQWLIAFAYFALIISNFGLPGAHITKNSLRPFARPVLTFTIMSFFLVGSNNINVILVSRLSTVEEAALYALAFKVVQAFILLRPIVMRALFPSMVKIADSLPDLQLLTSQMFRTIVILLAPIPVMLLVLAEPIINLLYGAEFEEAVPTLQILGWGVLLSFLSVGLHRILLATNKDKVALWVSVIATGLNLFVGIILIPEFGATGAAFASLVSLLGAFLLTFGWLRFEQLYISIGFVFVRPMLSLLLAISFAFLLNNHYHLHLVISILVFIMVYLVALFLVRAVSRTEIENFWLSTRGYILNRT